MFLLTRTAEVLGDMNVWSPAMAGTSNKSNGRWHSNSCDLSGRQRLHGPFIAEVLLDILISRDTIP